MPKTTPAQRLRELQDADHDPRVVHKPPRQPDYRDMGYECVCCHCGEHFYHTNKRAVTCPVCSQPKHGTD